MDFIVLVWLSPSSFGIKGDTSLAVLSVLRAFAPFNEFTSSSFGLVDDFAFDNSSSSESDEIAPLPSD